MDSVLLYTKGVLHQRTYTSEITLAASYLGLSTESWAWAAWEHKASMSEVARCQKGETETIIRAFVLLKHVDEARRLLNLPIEALQWTTVFRCYELLEAEVAARTETLGIASKHFMSLRTRGFLNRFLETAGVESVHKVRSDFKSAFKPSKNGRALISDEPTVVDGKKLSPIGAIPHSDIEDLRKRTSEILTRPLEQIAAACGKQLDEYDALNRWKAEMLAKEPDEEVLAKLEAGAHRKNWSRAAYAWARSLPLEKLAIAYLHLLYRVRPDAGAPAPQVILRGKEIDAFISQSLGLNRLGARLIRPEPLNAQNLLACLFILQIHTHWNVNAVLELTLRSLSSTEFPLEIQSYKSRPGVPTPIVSVERGDAAARALRFLSDRLEGLKKMHLVDETEQRLWMNLTGKPFVGWGSMLRPFQRKWGLPRFSLEQIRTQVAAAQSVQVGGLAVAKESAGHASLSTTSSYINKLLTHRLNSSANLEFQRRLEADVRTVADGGEAKYLYPIGDGSSCANPMEPPFESDLEGGACKAERCHVGNGCSNRRIVLDDDRVEEAVRTARYYRESWVRLYERNPSAFEKFHVPSMNFNFALLGMLRQGSYAHVVRAAEAAMTDGTGEFNG